MPKYYCDYCDTFLTHDSPSVRKTHCTGRKHKDNVKFYYQKWMEEQAQHLIDATTGKYNRKYEIQKIQLEIFMILIKKCFIARFSLIENFNKLVSFYYF